MKHRELTDHITGSFLKQQYLEAFLVQSAYIESLLRRFADHHLFVATVNHTKEGHTVIAAARNHVKGMDLRRLITFTREAELISADQSRQLNIYKDRRNQTIHDLIKELKKEEFDTELRKVCVLGNKIIESKEFSKIGEMLDGMERQTEASHEAIHTNANANKSITTKKSIKRRTHTKKK